MYLTGHDIKWLNMTWLDKTWLEMIGYDMTWQNTIVTFLRKHDSSLNHVKSYTGYHVWEAVHLHMSFKSVGIRLTHLAKVAMISICRRGGCSKTCEKKEALLNGRRETCSFSSQVGTQIRMSKASVFQCYICLGEIRRRWAWWGKWFRLRRKIGRILYLKYLPILKNIKVKFLAFWT